jgi:DivIVA domain-containing protein
MASTDFTVVIRGYDRHQVDAAIDAASRLVAAGQVEVARELVSGTRFDVVLRGYDRGQVEAHFAALVAP